MNNNLAPIVLFVYNRLEHTKKTVEALQKNNLSKESILYIYSDGYKSPTDKEKVLEVRKYIQTISGFKHIYIKEQNKNKGLANSIIEGITFVVNKHDKVIVLEDDIVTSPFFLDFLNSALTFYEYYDKVWHISGWNYPINRITSYNVCYTKLLREYPGNILTNLTIEVISRPKATRELTILGSLGKIIYSQEPAPPARVNPPCWRPSWVPTHWRKGGSPCAAFRWRRPICSGCESCSATCRRRNNFV